MNPGFAVRLHSMQRALTTMIMPAIDPNNQIAQEQAALLCAHLGMLTTQWDHMDEYARLCLADLVEVARRLEAKGGSATLASGDALTAALQSPPRAADLDGDAVFRAALHREVLLHGNRQAARDRSWFIQCGFDVNAGELPSIDRLLVESETMTDG
jgi:hypothetical protein